MNENIPPLVPAKKGMPVLGWVGIGCGTMVLLAIVAMVLMGFWVRQKVGDLSEFQKNPEKAAAEMMVRLNPDLTKVSQDDAKGEMTIRTKDGQEMTLSYKDISEGKFTIKDAQGNVTQIGKSDLSKVPAWVPQVPGLKTTSAVTQNNADGKLSGLYVASSSESISKVEEFFKAATENLKFTETSRQSFNADGVENLIVMYECGGRKINLVLTGKPGEDVQANVGYEEETPE